jgi:hypothetical protein
MMPAQHTSSTHHHSTAQHAYTLTVDGQQPVYACQKVTARVLAPRYTLAVLHGTTASAAQTTWLCIAQSFTLSVWTVEQHVTQRREHSKTARWQTLTVTSPHRSFLLHQPWPWLSEMYRTMPLITHQLTTQAHVQVVPISCACLHASHAAHP